MKSTANILVGEEVDADGRDLAHAGDAHAFIQTFDALSAVDVADCVQSRLEGTHNATGSSTHLAGGNAASLHGALNHFRRHQNNALKEASNAASKKRVDGTRHLSRK